MTWWDWHLYLYRFWRDKQREDEQLEAAKILIGRLCATIGNFAGKTLKPGAFLTEKDFFRFESDTVPDEIDLQELMNRPDIKFRFKKKGDG